MAVEDNQAGRVFPSDMALIQWLYLVEENVTKQCPTPMRHWGERLSQLSIICGDRLRLDLSI